MDWYQRALGFAERFDLLQQGSKLAVKWTPVLLKLILVLALGHVLTRVLQRLVRWASARLGLDKLAEEFELDAILASVGFSSIETLLVKVTGALGVCATVYLAADVVQISALTMLVGAVIAYIPTLLTAAMILLGGVALAALARRSLEGILAKRIERDELMRLVPASVYFVLIGLTAVVTAEQLGINVELIQSVALITLASALLGVVGALALGGTSLVGQLTARFHARRAYALGDVLEIGGVTGRLVRFGPTVALLESDGARVVVPYENLVCAGVMRRSTMHATAREEAHEEEE